MAEMKNLKKMIAELPCGGCEFMCECDDCHLPIDAEKLYDEIRAEVIEEIKGLAQHYLIGAMDLENATKYGNKNAKQQDISYGTLMRYEIADCVDDFIDSVEGLKEQK